MKTLDDTSKVVAKYGKVVSLPASNSLLVHCRSKIQQMTRGVAHVAHHSQNLQYVLQHVGKHVVAMMRAGSLGMCVARDSTTDP